MLINATQTITKSKKNNTETSTILRNENNFKERRTVKKEKKHSVIITSF